MGVGTQSQKVSLPLPRSRYYTTGLNNRRRYFILVQFAVKFSTHARYLAGATRKGLKFPR